MSKKRRAAKLSECENVAKKSKKEKTRSSTRDFIRRVKSLYYTTVKNDQCRGITVALTDIFGLGFEYIKANAQNLICFIKCSLVTLHYT